MKILLTVKLHARETDFLQSGNFPVLPSEFKKDPDWTAAVAAYEWIEKIKANTGYSADFSIIEVRYNSDHDITDLVKSVRPNSDLPFK